MGKIVQFSNKTKQDNDYLDTCLNVATYSNPTAQSIAALLRAAYDDDRELFMAIAEGIFANREALVYCAWSFHNMLKTGANYEYTETLRPPKGYDWVHTEEQG
jgi:hypothetical protein